MSGERTEPDETAAVSCSASRRRVAARSVAAVDCAGTESFPGGRWRRLQHSSSNPLDLHMCIFFWSKSIWPVCLLMLMMICCCFLACGMDFNKQKSHVKVIWRKEAGRSPEQGRLDAVPGSAPSDRGDWMRRQGVHTRTRRHHDVAVRHSAGTTTARIGSLCFLEQEGCKLEGLIKLWVDNRSCFFLQSFKHRHAFLHVKHDKAARPCTCLYLKLKE